MALVADVDVLFAGDLCFFGVTPLAFQGDPATWADVLDAVAELADTIVPGRRRRSCAAHPACRRSATNRRSARVLSIFGTRFCTS